jgi:hypothetical protein
MQIKKNRIGQAIAVMLSFALIYHCAINHHEERTLFAAAAAGLPTGQTSTKQKTCLDYLLTPFRFIHSLPRRARNKYRMSHLQTAINQEYHVPFSVIIRNRGTHVTVSTVHKHEHKQYKFEYASKTETKKKFEGLREQIMQSTSMKNQSQASKTETNEDKEIIMVRYEKKLSDDTVKFLQALNKNYAVGTFEVHVYKSNPSDPIQATIKIKENTSNQSIEQNYVLSEPFIMNISSEIKQSNSMHQHDRANFTKVLFRTEHHFINRHNDQQFRDQFTVN